MQQRTKSKTHSERAWEAYQKEKRLRKMQQEEQIRRYKFILALVVVLLMIYCFLVR